MRDSLTPFLYFVQYYADYAQLRAHFLKLHFLCELDDCSKSAATTHEYVVFRNDLDLQAHKKQTHAKSKSEAKTYGKLNIEFNMSRASNNNNNNSGGSSGRGRGKKVSVLVDDSDQQYHAGTDRRQQQLPQRRSPEVEASVANLSKAQFVRDEEERLRQKRNESLKEQYERWEQENPLPQMASAKPAEAVKEKEKEKEEKEEEVVTAQQSMWRSVVGQGNAPKINKEAEFPSLVSEGSSRPVQGMFSSQASRTAWGGSSAVTSKNSEPKQQAVSKKQGKKAKQQQKEHGAEVIDGEF